MFIKKKSQIVKEFHSFEAELECYEIVDASLGAKGQVCILAVNRRPELVNGMFPPVQTEESFDYKIIIKTPQDKIEVLLTNQKWNYHMVQPIDKDHILVASARSEFYEDHSFDLNAKVFDTKGNLLREFLLGDGIQHLYVTEENNIWTSYFDEGVFGNYGWKNPIGANGLRAWDSKGSEKYKYPNNGKHFIVDCYALNVVSDEDVWFYYYSDFEVGRYFQGRIEYYKPDVDGSDGFAVYDDHLLFRDKEDKGSYILYTAGKRKKLKRKCVWSFMNEENQTIHADIISCRGPQMLLLEGKKVYLVDLRDLVGE